MAYFDRYKRRISLYGNTSRERIINDQRHILEFQFEDHPSCYQVYLNGSADAMGLWIIENSAVKDTQEFISKYENPVNSGDLILWNGWHWLVIHKDDKTDIYHKGVISKCIAELKWLDDNGQIQSTYFVYRNEDLTNFGIDDGKIISFGNERRHLYVSANEHTKKLRKNKRFIIDDRAWKIISVDRLKQGLVYIVLQEDEIDETRDNLELQIADYYGNVNDNTSDDIDPTNPSEPESDVHRIEINGSDDIKYGQSRTYQVVIYLNEIETNSPALFELFADDQINSTSLAKITSQDGSKCTIKNNNSSAGFVQLKVTIDEFGIYTWKRLEMKPLF